MQERARTRRVRVPASTSNLGPGFDFLGLALELWLDVEARPLAGGAHRRDDAAGEATAWPAVEDDLVVRAFERGRAALGLPPLALALRVRSEIPLARGLGSSGAAIAAGLLLAAGWDDPRRATLERATLLRLGAELEGHPDNTSASLAGGCTLAVPDGEELFVQSHPVHETIGFAVAWPSTPVPTARARAALPASVPFADAVENPRRAAVLLAGLRSGDPRCLRLGIEDRLHVHARLPLIRGGPEALAAAREAGAWAATISGSGSTLIALSPHELRARVADAMRDALQRVDPPAHGRAVEVARTAPVPRLETE